MRRILIICGLLTCTAATTRAQLPQPGYGAGQQGQPGQYGPFDQFQPYVNPNQFMPNIYNPQTQPLSPYLYTVRGNNPAVDYFFGTRPGTLGMGSRGGGGAPFMAPGGGSRMTFFPQLQYGPDPLQSNVTSENSVLGPAGHPVVFSNTLGYFPSAFGQAGARSGLSGFGGAGQKK